MVRVYQMEALFVNLPHSARHTFSHRRFKRIARVVIFTIAIARFQIASLTILNHDR
jgi:hypothetical protein